MIVERNNNEILIRFKAGAEATKLQPLLDYLEYVELTSKSVATENSIEELLKGVKKGRWNRIKKEIGWND